MLTRLNRGATHRPVLTLVVALLLALSVRWGHAAPVDADVVLAGGTIIDGSGSEGFVGDVAIAKDRIVAVGQFECGRVGRVIDCRGLVVVPGFIDLHTHSDRTIVSPATRANVNYLTQGCTTSVTGNCGSGPVDVAAYFKKIDEQGAGTNVIHLLPQGSLRSSVMGSENRAPTPQELARMRELAAQAMRDGAWGMSTGLIYVPGVYAQTDELVEIARVVAEHGGLYASHIRGEGTQLLDAVREALEIGRQAGLPVHVSHFKASGRDVWGTLRAAAQIIIEARQQGQTVTADQYPYIASSTSLEATVLPPWSRAGGRKALVARLKDETDGPKIRAEVEKRLKVTDRLQIAGYGPRGEWVGKLLSQIAEEEGLSQVDLVVEMELNGGARIVNFGMDEQDVRFAMTLDWVATASDGSAKAPDADKPHPRSYGTFPRKIGLYAIQEGVLTLPQAVRSASGLPADILRLDDRGYLRPGLVADVVAFDPAALRDQATFEDPYRYSTGVRHVFVNGQPAIHEGTPTGALAGKALRHPLPGNTQSGAAER